jgi:hypothetical protein
MDSHDDLGALQRCVVTFRDERDWYCQLKPQPLQ